MRIIRARLKPFGGSSEFVSIKGRIKGLIERNKGDVFNFVIDDGGIKSVKEFGPDYIDPELVGKTIIILDGPYYAIFNEDGIIDITEIEAIDESLPRQHTVDQLKKLRKLTKGIDIGDRISDLNKQGANISYYRNAIDSGIESYEDFEKSNKKFIPSWNLKNLMSPYSNKIKRVKDI